MIGLGDSKAFIRVFIQNVPSRQPWLQIEQVESLPKGEIAAIRLECGNRWLKVFNVYAKWLFAMRYIDGLDDFTPLWNAKSWQDYRDDSLLQLGSNTSLLFSKPSEANCSDDALNIIMGRTYAKDSEMRLTWLDNEFAYQRERNIVVCPYFDYRQLSNHKIIQLCRYIEELALLKGQP